MAQEHDTTGFMEVLQEISESGNPLLTMLRMMCQEFMELEVSQRSVQTGANGQKAGVGIEADIVTGGWIPDLEH